MGPTPVSQQARTLSVTTPLGDDVLLLRSMTGREALSTLFAYELELVSDDIGIRPEDLLGQPATVRLAIPNRKPRYFHGIVNRFSHVGFDGADAIFRATLVPWLWFLTRTADCRIFQEKTVPDIVEEIFREHEFTDIRPRLSGTYRQWVYCVQYREADFNFISRLLEQKGIYYYFSHEVEDGVVKHILVLSDDESAHDPVEGYETVPYYPPDATALREREHIDDWTVSQEVRPGRFTHDDFDFTAPGKDLLEMSGDPKEHALANYEIFDYPGEYTEPKDGERYARIRLEEMQADYEITRAHGNARGLTAGALFTLSNYPRDDQNRQYLIVSTNYRLRSELFGSTGQSAKGPFFRCSITAIDSQVPYRPPQITRKPVVQGPQTAIVVGKEDQEIWTDKYGRVKVLFHWDRGGTADQNSSCWIRVAQMWAGNRWGRMMIPRIGQEVIVDFLEGDPDRPIITGRFYNQASMPPYALPEHATRTTLKSNSSKGGGGFNELRFEDKKGKEHIFLHAERNLNIRVKATRKEWIGYERHLTVEKDAFESFKKNIHRTVEEDRIDEIKGDSHFTLEGDRMAEIRGSEHLTVTNDRNVELLDGDDNLMVGGNSNQEARSHISLKAGQSIHAKAAQAVSLDGGSEVHQGRNECRT